MLLGLAPDTAVPRVRAVGSSRRRTGESRHAWSEVLAYLLVWCMFARAMLFLLCCQGQRPDAPLLGTLSEDNDPLDILVLMQARSPARQMCTNPSSVISAVRSGAGKRAEGGCRAWRRSLSCRFASCAPSRLA